MGGRVGGVREVDRDRRGDHIRSRGATVEEGVFRRSTAGRDRQLHSTMGGLIE